MGPRSAPKTQRIRPSHGWKSGPMHENLVTELPDPASLPLEAGVSTVNSPAASSRSMAPCRRLVSLLSHYLLFHNSYTPYDLR